MLWTCADPEPLSERRPFYSSVRHEHVSPPIDTFPAEWFEPPIDGASLALARAFLGWLSRARRLTFAIPPSPLAETYLTSTTYRPEVNKYRVKASQSIEEWEKAGWCRPQDPRGWMEVRRSTPPRALRSQQIDPQRSLLSCRSQWYVQFFLGRRSPDDVRQIQRWAGCAGPRGRFKTSLVKKIAQAGGVDHLHNPEVAPILRQTLLHWAVELTQESFEAYLA